MNMKMKKCLPLLGAILLCSCHIDIDIGVHPVYEYKDGDIYSKGNTTYEELSNLAVLDIDWVCGDVTIKAYDGTGIKIEEDDEDLLPSQLVRHLYNEEDETLTIKFCKSGIDEKKMDNLKKNLFVYIPQDAVIKYLDYNSASGNLDVTDIYCKKCEIDIASGDAVLAFKGETTEFVEADCLSGNITLTGEYVKEFEFDCASGEVNIATNKAPEKAEIDGASVEVNLYLPEDIPGFKIKLCGASTRFSNKGSGFSIDSEEEIVTKTYTYGDKSSSFKIDGLAAKLQIFKLSDYGN